MSLDTKRDEIGRLLTCLLVSRKEACTIRDLERDFKEQEGKNIPYRDFGCHSVVDFLRRIPNHVTLSRQSGDYMVYPVISEKIQHVNDLVIRQKSAKKSTPGRRRQSRPSRYFPMVSEPKPFIENSVQKKIAHMLVDNPSGVEASLIARCLTNSNTIARPVDQTNVGDYINGVPHIAVASGSYIYPSRSLTATMEAKQQKTDGNMPVAPDMSSNIPGAGSRNNTAACPGGFDEGGVLYDELDDEDFGIEPSVGNLIVDDNYWPDQFLSYQNGNGTNVSSAELLGHIQNQEQHQRQNDAGNIDGYSEKEYFSSAEDEAVDVISARLQSRLEKLIKKHPDGIWCANLLEKFLEEYKFPLDYVELGFASVCELAASLKKIFRLHRWNDRGDFMLYDASQPLPSSLKEPNSYRQTPICEDELNDNDDMEPFPLNLALQASAKLIPNDVMAQNESVGQERIPEITADEDCIEVYVADVYTPSLFWIHLRKKRVKLHRLMNSMHDFYQQVGDKYTIPHVILEKGLNCVCLFEDRWHRALIKTVKPDGDITLIFYDFGTTKTYPPDSVRYLHRGFSNLPAQSISCGLYNVKPLHGDVWTRGASSEFWNKVQDLPLMAMVIKIDRDNNSMLVSLVDTQYEDDFHINDWMVHENLAKYGSMETVTTDTTPYYEDLEIPAEDASAKLKDVPLIRPHSTMVHPPGSSTLKSPPGFTKRSEPMNAAEFVNSFVQGTGHNAAELEAYMNLCNNNSTYSPLILPTETIVQILKNQLKNELEKQIEDRVAEAYKKFAPASLDSSNINGTTLINSNTDPSSSYTNSIPQQRNPFQQEFATTTKNVGAFNTFSTNLDSNKNPFSITTSPDVAELPNVDFTVSNGSIFNLEKVSSELSSLEKQESCAIAHSNPIYEDLHSFNPESPIQSSSDTCSTDFLYNENYSTANETPNGQSEINGISEKALFNEARFVQDLKNTNNNFNSTVNNAELANQQFHCTNPFKIYATKNLTDNIDPQKEQSCKIKVENYNSNNKPPIPPRNPNLVNRSLNLAPKDTTTTHVKPAELPTVQNKTPTTKIIYQAKPVMYNLRKTDASQTNGRPDEEILKSMDTVSFRDKQDNDIADSSQRHTNTSFNSQKANLFVTSRPHCLRPEILPNTYSKSKKYPYKNKSVSPRFISPVLSETSIAAIEEIRLITELNVFNELEPEVIEAQSSMIHDRISKDPQTRNKHTSSFVLTNENTLLKKNAETISYLKNTITFKALNTMNVISKKFQQDQQSSENLNREPPNLSIRNEPVSETLKPDTTHTVHFVKQELIEHAKSSHEEHHQPHNPNCTAPRSSERTGNFVYTFEPVIDTKKPTATHIDDGSELENKKNDSSNLPNSYISKASVNEENPFGEMNQNPEVTSQRDVAMKYKNSQLFDAKAKTLPANAASPHCNHLHEQPHLQNTSEHYAPMFTPSPMQHGLNYPYYVPHTLQYPGTNPNLPMFRISTPGYYRPQSNWPITPFYNPGYVYQYPKAPYPCEQSHFWSQYNSRMFAQTTAQPTHKMETVKWNMNSKSEFARYKVSPASKSNCTETLLHENKENINTSQHDQMSNNLPENPHHKTELLTPSASTDPLTLDNASHGLTKVHSSDTPNFKECTLSTQPRKARSSSPIQETVKSEENSMKETGSTQECINSATLPMVTKNDKNLAESFEQNLNTLHQSTPAPHTPKIFKAIEVNDRTIYLFNINHQGWVCTDEITQSFTNYPNRNVVLFILERLRVHIDFAVVERTQSPELFSELDNTSLSLPRMRNTKKIKGSLHLTPLKSLARMMVALQVVPDEEFDHLREGKEPPPGSVLRELVTIITSYKANDEYWVS